MARPRSPELDAAEALSRRGAVLQAVEAYSAFARSHPEDPRPWVSIGTLLVENDQYADAVEALLEADRLEPGTSEADAWLGVAIARSGRPADGLDKARGVVRALPKSPVAHRLLAELAEDQGLYNEAVAARRTVVGLAPEDASAWRSLGNACFASKDFKGLGDAGKALLRLVPDDADAPVWVALATAVLGSDAEAKAAEIDMVRWTERFPDRFSGWYALGRLRKRLHAWGPARDAYREAARRSPGRGEPYADLAVIERMLGDGRAAAQAAERHRRSLAERRAYEDAVRAARAVEAGIRLQVAAFDAALLQGELRVARECLARATRLAPGDPAVAAMRTRIDRGNR